MTHDLWSKQPWLSAGTPFAETPIGMLGAHEAMLFYHVAKSAFAGRGTIVDAGSYLGKSAFFLAHGLRNNERFDRHRDRVHCFDLFRVFDTVTKNHIQEKLGLTLQVGDSTRSIFEKQAATVRDTLEVHEGDFLAQPWRSQAVEILMVDIAKSQALGQKVVELLFPDLIPGHSIVIQQDYHHPWHPHIHITMEFLAEYFRMVAPRVNDSAVFVLERAIPAAMLRRVIDFDFTFAEKLALMDAALTRFRVEDRFVIELARLRLLSEEHHPAELLTYLATTLARYPGYSADPLWSKYATGIRCYLDNLRTNRAVVEGFKLRDRGEYQSALTIAEDLIEDGTATSLLLLLRGTSLEGLGRYDEAEASLRAALRATPRNGWAYINLAGVLSRQGKTTEAEEHLVAGALDRSAPGPQTMHFLDHLAARWHHAPRPDEVSRIMGRLIAALPTDPEVWALNAKVRAHQGDRDGAKRCIDKARSLARIIHERVEVREEDQRTWGCEATQVQEAPPLG